MAYVKNGFLITKDRFGDQVVNINHIRLISRRNDMCTIFFTYHDGAEYLELRESYEEIERALGLNEEINKEFSSFDFSKPCAIEMHDCPSCEGKPYFFNNDEHIWLRCCDNHSEKFSGKVNRNEVVKSWNERIR